MIKRPTWFLLIILALVIVAYFVIKNRIPAESTTATPTALGNNFLVQADGTLKSLLITDNQNLVVEIQRDSRGTWIVEKPIFGVADQALAEAAGTQVGSLRIVTTLDNQLNLGDTGLDSPPYTIELTFTSGLKHIIQVGSLTPTSSGYYVRYDSGNIYVISKSGIDALLNLLTAPPYVATETLVPTIEGTATATLEDNTPIP